MPILLKNTKDTYDILYNNKYVHKIFNLTV